MKPLSEQELSEKIDDYIDRFRMQWKVEGDEYHQSELIEDIVQLIIQDRKALGEQLLEDLKLTASKHYYTRGYGEPTILVSEWVDYLDLKIKEQRNQGEKTDE